MPLWKPTSIESMDAEIKILTQLLSRVPVEDSMPVKYNHIRYKEWQAYPNRQNYRY
jgi:hypothetical protein